MKCQSQVVLALSNRACSNLQTWLGQHTHARVHTHTHALSLLDPVATWPLNLAPTNQHAPHTTLCFHDPHQTDRTKTPWLLVSTHAPWYVTYSGHYKENECMRQGYEPLMVKYGVDVMFFGHVHSYERTKPVVDYQVRW